MEGPLRPREGPLRSREDCNEEGLPSDLERIVTRMRVGLQLHGILRRCKKNREMGLRRLDRIDDGEFNGAGLDAHRFPVLQLFSIATSCNTCNILEILHSGFPRPAESIPDESRAPFLVVFAVVVASGICAIEVLFQCLQRVSPGLAQNKNLDEAGHSSVNI